MEPLPFHPLLETPDLRNCQKVTMHYAITSSTVLFASILVMFADAVCS